MWPKIRRPVSCVSAVALVLLAACGAAGASEEPRTIVIGVTQRPTSLDFSDGYSWTEYEIMSRTNVGLMKVEPGTGKIVPGVAAESPSVSADGLSVTFRLNSGWTYPDGTEVEADDFVRSINRSLSLDGIASSILVTPYVHSVEAPDARTVVFHLIAPRPDFPQIVTTTPYMPIPEGAYPDDELLPFPETIAGVGAWQVTTYDIEGAAVLERNPHYKLGFSESAPDRIVLRFMEDAPQVTLALEAGDIDIAWRSLSFAEAARLSDVEGVTVHSVGSGYIFFLAPNHALEPFDDKSVRQAIAYLVDRDEIVDVGTQGAAAPLYSHMPPSFLGSTDAFLDRYHAPDVPAAEELLRSAGYSESTPLSFDLWYAPHKWGPHVAQLMQIIERQLEATPLVQVNIQPIEWGVYIPAIVNNELPMFYMSWYFDYPDPSAYIDNVAESDHSAGVGINYANPEMDDLLYAASATTDRAEREALYTQVHALFAEDAVTIPLIEEPIYAASRDETVSDLLLDPYVLFRYESIEIK